MSVSTNSARLAMFDFGDLRSLPFHCRQSSSSYLPLMKLHANSLKDWEVQIIRNLGRLRQAGWHFFGGKKFLKKKVLSKKKNLT